MAEKEMKTAKTKKVEILEENTTKTEKKDNTSMVVILTCISVGLQLLIILEL